MASVCWWCSGSGLLFGCSSGKSEFSIFYRASDRTAWGSGNVTSLQGGQKANHRLPCWSLLHELAPFYKAPHVSVNCCSISCSIGCKSPAITSECNGRPKSTSSRCFIRPATICNCTQFAQNLVKACHGRQTLPRTIQSRLTHLLNMTSHT